MNPEWYSLEVATRSYGQMCSVARALDVLGERWTLLIVRELLLGPKRFKDLLEVLPAMGTNRLGDRLSKLQAAGVVVRTTLPPPAGVRVYELTESGQRLRPAIDCLGAWGRQLPLPPDVDRGSARAELVALGLAAVSPAALSAGLEETYEFRVGEEHFHVAAHNATVRALSGAAPGGADLLVECDLSTFFALAAGDISAEEALGSARATVKGDPQMLTRAFTLLSLGHEVSELRLAAA